MDIKELKSKIEEKNVDFTFYIFKYEDIDFLPNQYLQEISNILNLEINYVNDISLLFKQKNSLFDGGNINTYLNVFNCETLNINNEILPGTTKNIVICKSISKDSFDLVKDFIIEFPKLEKWQIKDYVYSLADGINTKYLDHLIEVCNWDIYRLDKELEKIKIFNKTERCHIYDSFIDDDIFNDLTNHTIFDFTNAILKKDIKSLKDLYKEIEKIDCEPLGLVTVLYKNLKNIISIQLSNKATPENVGLPTNRFWAIKKNMCGYYTKDQLLNAFYLITEIDKKLKTGELTTDIMIDYIVCKIFSY